MGGLLDWKVYVATLTFVKLKNRSTDDTGAVIKHIIRSCQHVTVEQIVFRITQFMMQPVVWYTTRRCAELVGQECDWQFPVVDNGRSSSVRPSATRSSSRETVERLVGSRDTSSADSAACDTRSADRVIIIRSHNHLTRLPTAALASASRVALPWERAHTILYTIHCLLMTRP